MATRKKHHYIPQFYLKRFAIDDGKKLIALYNHKNKLFIPAAQIRHQACEKYLYGTDDEVEQGLSFLENQAAYIIGLILDKKYPPPPAGTNASDWLKKFIIFQLSRTPQAGKDLDNALNAGFQTVFDSTDLQIKHENPVLLSLLHSDQYQPILKFLHCKLLLNQSNLPYIISDHPVIKYNQWMEKSGHTLGTTGLGVRGLQIFFPIHPEVMLCYYDPFVYKCGVKDKFLVLVQSDNDVHQLNALQYLFSDHQLFIGQPQLKEYIIFLVSSFEPKRLENKSVVFANRKNPEPRNKIIMNTFKDPQINLGLSFFNIKTKVRKEGNARMLPELRHPSFKDLKFNL